MWYLKMFSCSNFIEQLIFSQFEVGNTQRETVFTIITLVFVNYFHMQRLRIINFICSFISQQQNDIFLYLTSYPIVLIHHSMADQIRETKKMYLMLHILSENSVRLFDSLYAITK